MSMKKILMAAAAVTALTAGSAGAASIDQTSTVGGKQMTPSGSGGVVGATTFEAYTIANELNVATPPTAAAVIKLAPTSATTVGSGNYIVTFNITGGTFTTSPVVTTDLTFAGTGLTAATTVNSVNSVNANSIAFNVTVGAGQFITTFDFANTLKLGSNRDSVAVSGKIDTAGGAQVDGGLSLSKTIIDYRSGYKVAATAVDTQLTLASAYKKFTGDVPSFNIATGLLFAENQNSSSDRVYKTTTGTPVAMADLTTAVLTLTGDVSALDPKISTVAPDASTTNVFTAAAGSANLAALQGSTGVVVTLAQKTTPVAGNASAYSIAPVVTMAAGFTAPTFSAVTLGAVTLEGTNFYAPWIGDGTNGITYTVRLGNRATTAVSGITVTLLNSQNTPTATSCNVGTLPASGELLISSATLKTCFGAFGRGDVRITAQVASTSVTAKLRSVSANVVNEVSLGGGSKVASQD